MVPSGNLLLLLLLPAAAAQSAPGSCSGCGSLSPLLLASLVAVDALVSLLIVVVVFVRTCPGVETTQEEGKIYINMPGGRG